jgi:kynurenine formamidase
MTIRQDARFVATEATEATEARTAQASTAPARTAGWWPSRWGADDQAGALNEITPDVVLAAVSLVRRGTLHDLAHVLHADVPAFPGRTFRSYLTTNAHHVNRRKAVPGRQGLGAAEVNWVVEQITATQQMGTHMDGLNHLQVGDRTYNGHRLGDIAEEYGTNRLGVEALPQALTRGVLLDIAAVRGVQMLDPGDVITVEDAEHALQRAGLTLRPGDAVLFHTGWGQLWGVDDDRYGSGEPGPGLALAEWLADHRIALTGCDTWSYGPYPAEDADSPFVVPQTLNVRHGVVIVENLRLADAARDSLTEFLFVLTHAKLRGATGAWVTPLAVT